MLYSLQAPVYQSMAPFLAISSLPCGDYYSTEVHQVLLLPSNSLLSPNAV